MTNIKDKILSEVDAIAPGYVQVMAEMMEECPTLAAMIANSCVVAGGVSTGFVIDKNKLSVVRSE